ncbi:MAG: ribonuclease HII [Candidatus Woykebacteria bacterium RBG_13_40_7b]|uniref:Ribonuclease HII n=1 Tax=Candidatus Woykebacteria bacterium RBG_13_40_7b TaxID=1802594 RepID=A0A1G1WAW2_9BACT|nr:MAG: ribonuclease HII [Candidatus Woykebacteria bacterium RBG_13_40_7b]
MKLASFDQEKNLWSQGLQYIAGVDEVGRGAWAGPVVAAAVIFPQDIKINFPLCDSKLMAPKLRDKISEIILKRAVSVGYGIVGVRIINKIGIGRATQKAFRLALKNLEVESEFELIDAFYIRHLAKRRQRPIKKGDGKVASIAAASIVAKVFRDDLMVKLHDRYPVYGFYSHKGYGTKFHQEAIKKYGLSSIHRKNFHLKFLFMDDNDEEGGG